MRMHYAILAVITIALAESIMWFAAYLDMNESGEPYCCPVPPTVVAAMSLELLRRTVSRALLLVLCLGWGTVTPALKAKDVSVRNSGPSCVC